MSSWTRTGDDCHNRSPLDACFQSLYFSVFVLYNTDVGFVAVVKSCRIVLNGVRCGFVDLKKTELLTQE
jgi:hypothetical protein